MARARHELAGSRGMSRARLYALHAVLAATVACGGTDTTGSGDAAADSNGGDSSTHDSGDSATSDAVADTAADQDAGDNDAIADATFERPCCPPYGCVFPDACDGIRV